VDWLNCEWDALNGEKLEEFVDNASKTMSDCIRHFKNKEMTGILKIADTVKKEIDEFKPYVPLAVALRKKGMNDRHWA